MSEEAAELPNEEVVYVYKTDDEWNMEKIKLLADLGCYNIIDEEKTSTLSADGGVYMNLFDGDELHIIKRKILELITKL